MKCRNLLAGLFGVCLLFVMAGTVISPTFAQDAPPPGEEEPATEEEPTPNTGDSTTTVGTGENKWEIKVSQEEIDAYTRTINESGCTTPSLECLVRNTTRFVAIEWVQEIMGPNLTVDFNTSPATPDGDGGTPDSYLRQTSPVAQRGGIIHGVFGLIGGMFAYQPAKTSRYVADVINTADLAPPAYAQGIGFASLDPVLSLWKMFRNVAYFFFIAVFIIIGFLIMFRQKVGGQAAITAQQAIPSIIISLILVTFSYAIAGLLIDMMYLFMFMLLYLFNFTTTGTGSVIPSSTISWSIFHLGAALITDIADPANNAGLIDAMVQNLMNMSEGNWGSSLAGWIGGLTLSVVLAIAVLIGMVKLFFELLKSYASIIMGVIFAPFYLMLGAFPGKNAFTPWLKNMIGNLAAFPAVLLFVMLYQVFTENVEMTSGGFLPPFLVGGSGQSGIASYLLGLAIVLALPEVVKEVKKRMGATDGGFGWMVAGAAASTAKRGIPLGGRTASVVGGSLASIPTYGAELVRGGGWKRAHERGTAVRKAVIKKGIEATDLSARILGANQPDILNKITNKIDKRWAPETAERNLQFQTMEQMARYYYGGANPNNALLPMGATSNSSSTGGGGNNKP